MSKVFQVTRIVSRQEASKEQSREAKLTWGLWIFVILGLAALLVASSAHSEEKITGWIEGRRFLATSLPAYPDLTGEPMKYGIDFQLNFPTFVPNLNLMMGADSATNSHQFAQIAGRGGMIYKFRAVEFSLYHRSNHAIDEAPVNHSFPSENRFSIRYNFQVN